MKDTGPGPLTYLLDGALAKWAEPFRAEFWLRLPGFVIGVLAVPLIMLGYRKQFHLSGAIAGGALAAMLPVWVDWSTGARGYSWAVFCGLLQILLGLHLISRGPTRSLVAGLAVVSTAGLLLHPFHILMTLGIYLSLLTVRDLRRSSGYVASSALFVLCQFAWLAFWFTSVKRGASNGAVAIPVSVHSLAEAAALLLRNQWPLLLFLTGTAAGGFLAFRAATAPHWKFVGSLSVATSVFSMVLAVVLAAQFLLAFRYFYGATIPVVLLASYAVQLCSSRFHADGKVGRVRTIGVAALVVASAVMAVPAMQAANTPVHNWSAAVRWLKDHATAEDAVLTGPNSEYEMLKVYAAAAGLRAHTPLTISNGRGQILGVQSPEAVRALLNSGRRLWYVTAFYGEHRSPEYWNLIGENYREVARFSGRADLVLFRSR